MGWTAGDAVTTGYANTFVGTEAGSTGTNDLTTGTLNTLIGQATSVSANNATNQTVIGRGATAKGDNTFQLGNDSTVAWTFGTGSLQTWDAANVFRTIQLDTVTLACQNAGKPQAQAWLTNNFYYDDSNNRFQPIHTGESAAININDDGNIRFITSNGSDTVGSEITTLTALSIDNGGVVSGDLNDTSDRNLKKNIVSLSDTTEGVKKLNPVSFDWKHSNDKSLGFIAQEVEEIYPELVKNKEGSKSIKTAGIVAVLTKAVQELMEKNEALEKRLEELEGK